MNDKYVNKSDQEFKWFDIYSKLQTLPFEIIDGKTICHVKYPLPLDKKIKPKNKLTISE